jgi:hypothetical protein
MFHLGIPATEKIIRSVLVYVFLVIALRVVGKRELGPDEYARPRRAPADRETRSRNGIIGNDCP